MKIQILTAEENGVTEMLEKILKLFQVGNMDLDKKNIVLMGTKKPKAPLMETRETPIIIAAKNGIVEMMEEILEKFLEAINDVNAGEEEHCSIVCGEQATTCISVLALAEEKYRERKHIPSSRQQGE
ncbi:hypothetical protein OIU85_021589 [Salix viminalis]|uniref:Uncharacterized protein n=1 Tax=Salix viminalis TaxID=40686 RepID=A0A9Q0ZDR5_SALVM|nr:hypothetical protein OIU85_021589 [Salix viminalis]